MPVVCKSIFSNAALREAAQAAVKIVRGAFEKKPADERQHRIAEPAVFPRHRAGQNRSAADRQPAAHDQFKTFLKFFDETGRPRKNRSCRRRRP